MEWQDLRVVLAVARGGSVPAAAQELGVSTATVTRRLTALEQLGPPLFARNPDGLRPTAEGLALLDRARAVEDTMRALDERVQALGGRLEGTVRVATSLPWAEMLVPVLARLRETAPRLTVHLQVSNAVVDLARHEADIAVRVIVPGRRPEWAGVIARKIVSCGYALFGSARYFEQRGEAPHPVDDLAGHDLVAIGGSYPWEPGAGFIAAAGDLVRRAITTNNLHCAASAVAAGYGLAIVPCVLGRARGLIQLGPPIDHDDLYVAFAADLQNVPRVRAVIDAVVEHVGADAQRLRGDLITPRGAP